MIERYHLRAITAIHRTGTLTGAAETLYLTQSALSHAMKKLEQEMGTQFWEKNGRKIRLTQAGMTLLNLAQRVLPQFEHTEEQIGLIAEGYEGALRIGMECHPCYQWLLKVVRPFLSQYPGVDVDIRQAFQFGGLQALHGYDIDLLLTPDPLHLPSIHYEPVFDYEQVLVVSNEHPLAKQKQVAPQALAAETLLTYPVESSRLDIFSQFLIPAGCTVKRHKTLENTEILLQMVSAGRGVAALPDWLIHEQSPSLGLCCLRLGERGVKKSLHLGYRKNDVEARFLAAFVSLARKIGQRKA